MASQGTDTYYYLKWQAKERMRTEVIFIFAIIRNHLELLINHLSHNPTSQLATGGLEFRTSLW